MNALATARHSIFLNKKSPFGNFLLTKIGGGSGWIGSAKGLRRTRNVFATFYLQTQTRRRTKQTAFVSPNTTDTSGTQ